jgi:hypothetical protein
MHSIQLIEPLLGEPVYQAGRSRYPTVTDVAFINETRIATIHRIGCKAYLIDLGEDGAHTIVDTLDIVHNNEKVKTEMITYANGKLYMITYTDLMFVLEIVENKLTIVDRIVFKPGMSYHGLQAKGNHLYVTPSNNMSPRTDKIVKFNMTNKTFEYIESPDLLQKYLIKDITFLPNNMILLAICFKKDTNMCMKTFTNDAMIGLFDSSFRLKDKWMLPKKHIDSLIAKDNVFYVTIADDVGGFIMKGSVCGGKIVRSIDKIPVGDFPHGIDICGNKLAYTSYSDSTVCIIDI